MSDRFDPTRFVMPMDTGGTYIRALDAAAHPFSLHRQCIAGHIFIRRTDGVAAIVYSQPTELGQLHVFLTRAIPIPSDKGHGFVLANHNINPTTDRVLDTTMLGPEIFEGEINE